MLPHDLTDQAYLTTLLGQKGIHLRRSSGQHFLICDEVRQATVAALEGAPPALTELGAGLGTLTQSLLAADFRVRALESDERLIPLLRDAGSRFDDKFELQAGDMRDHDWTWPRPYSLVGNIPYNLSGLIIRTITGLAPAPDRVVLLVQREVGERLGAEPPNMHLLTLAVRLWGSVSKLLNVPRVCFWPPPQVDSQLVMLVPNGTHSHEEREQVLSVARVFFQERRKQIGGVLRRRFGLTADESSALVARLGLRTDMRPQEVSLRQWPLLTKALRP